MVVGFTVINVVLLVANSNVYFLFSDFVPYFLADYSMYFCGMYPQEYYYDAPDIEFADKSFFAVSITIAVVILLVYLLCWFFAKKKKIGWVIFALVIFVIDTAAMFMPEGFSTDSIFDIVIHAWVIFYLVNAIVVYFKLKKLPEEEFDVETAEESGQDDFSINDGNTAILTTADTDTNNQDFSLSRNPTIS